MSVLQTLRRNVFPPRGFPMVVASSNLLVGIGNGTYLTASPVYFAEIVGLQTRHIGVGLSIAAGCGLLAAYRLSRIVDRVDARRAWLTSTFVKAALFGLWPLADGFVSFLILLTSITLVTNVQETGRGVYLVEALDPQHRLTTQAFARSWLNLGWSLGAVLATVAFGIGTTAAYHGLVLGNAVFVALSGFLIWRLPAASRPVTGVNRGRPSKGVLHDRPYLALIGVCATLYCYSTIFTQVMPLWVLTSTDAARWWIGILTLINTVFVILLQVPMGHGAHTVPRAARVLRWSGWASALACLAFLGAGATSGRLTVVALIAAVVILTAAEIWQSNGAWTVAAELSPSDRRGEYLGTFRLGGGIQNTFGPVLLISLAVTTGGWGWLVISGIFFVAAIAIGPVVRTSASSPSKGS